MNFYLAEWIEDITGISPEVQARLLSTLIAAILLMLLQRAIAGLIRRRIDDVRTRYVWQKSSGYLVFILAIFIIGPIWFQGWQNAVTYLGFLTAGLAIALRDPISGFVGWVYILVSRPFGVGDRIQIGGLAGDVIDQRVFTFTLLEIGNWVDSDQSTGRVIYIPNGRVFVEPVINYEKGFQFIWNEIPVQVTLDSDWQKAKQIFQEIANRQAAPASEDAESRVRQASQRLMIYYNTLTPKVYTSVKNRGIMLTIRYLCEPRQRRTSTELIWEEILRAIQEHPDIKLMPPAA